MRTLEECKAEIFRRSEEKKRTITRRRRIAAALCVPLMLAAVVTAAYRPARETPVPESYENGTAADVDHATPGESVDLLAGVMPAPKPVADDLSAWSAATADFALRLFNACAEDGENTLVSPLSVQIALAMTANGADGETLAEMENVLGLPIGELNSSIYSYMQHLPQDGTLGIANAVYFRDSDLFVPDDGFLQNVADYYDASVRKAPFDDSTVQEINEFVNEKTNGLIPTLLQEIPDNAVMYLINALAFDAEWEDPFVADRIYEGRFTAADGSSQAATFMSTEEAEYLKFTNAVGFVKRYKGGRYAFAALLPDEGVTPEELAASLDAAELAAQLKQPLQWEPTVIMPRFEAEYDAELSDELAAMGMERAFDAKAAELSGVGSADGNLCIGPVIHKTKIIVNEHGTKAAAATGVGLIDSAEPKVVNLNRPFLYMLVDTENGIPLFVGSMNSLQG